MSTKIVVTGVGSPGGPGIINALRMSGRQLTIIGLDASSLASGAALCDHFITVPQASDQRYISELKSIIERHNVDLIMPLVTAELEILSALKQDISETYHCEVIVSDYSTLKQANDKIELYQKCQGQGVSLPEYTVTNTHEELKQAVAQYLRTANRCVIKPGKGNGSRGVRIITAHAPTFSETILGKPNSLEVPFELFNRIALDDCLLPRYMISQYIDGNEITVDLVVHDCQILVCMMRSRDQMRSGISTAGTFFFDRGLLETLQKIVNCFNFNGPVGFQFIHTNNEFFLIECNPRLQGTSMASMAFGVNIPAEILNVIEFGNCNRSFSTATKRFTRYYKEIFYDS